MKTQLFVVDPAFDCPFRVEGLHIVPTRSNEGGSTLLFLHAMSFHKETFMPLIIDLLNKVPGGNIKDIWAIDHPNQGRSAALNRALLESEEYREKWSATDYAKAVYAFLTMPSTGIDFKGCKLVGVSHSAGSVGLLTLLKLYPEITFQGIILMDPGLGPPNQLSTTKAAGFFRKMALLKRDTWASLDEAQRDLSRTGPYRHFAPAAFESFLKYGLHPVGNAGAVTLACSKAQEAAYYASDDILTPPAQTFVALSEQDKLRVHLIVCLKDEFRGMFDAAKAFQVETVQKMSCGSVQVIERGGHMFPQVEPELTADCVRNALIKIWDRGFRL